MLTSKYMPTQAYATVEYNSYTPEVASIHAITSVNGQVRCFLPA